MILKYGINIDNKVIANRLQNLINQTYKLLPNRQQGIDWEKPLQTILIELAGIQRLLNSGYSEAMFPLLSKLEGLHTLINEDDFQTYRRTIFECLNLMNALKEEICHQNY